MWLRRLLALGLILSAPGLLAATLPPVEPMPTLNAATLAPAELLNGAGYTVDASAPVVGYMGQFTLRAPAGTFNADGTEMLAIRVGELAAIAQLSQLSHGVFADALGQENRRGHRTGSDESARDSCGHPCRRWAFLSVCGHDGLACHGIQLPKCQ
jgi:hypothetical protein